MSTSHLPGPLATARGVPAIPTRLLLAAGLLAGPVLLGLAAAQAAVRDGFDLTRHPMSALATGPGGDVQIAAFVACGLLVVAAAAGLARVLEPTGAARWGIALVAVHGAGTVLAGVFTADPADGFPVGTPAGAPETLSWHAQAHAGTAMLAFVAILAAMLLLAPRLGERFGAGWRRGSRIAAAGVVLLMAVPAGPFSVRLALACALWLGWIGVVSHRTREMAP